jgi:hypothetical protein
MKHRKPRTEGQFPDHTTATTKVRVWRDRADKARQAGREADAERCDDKVRDWASRVKEIKRVQNRLRRQEHERTPDTSLARLLNPPQVL